MHAVEISPVVLANTLAQRSGQRHIFDNINPTKTAHLIVDLQVGFMAEGAPVEVPVAREIVDNVNTISAAVRAAGGLNVFLRFTTNPEDLQSWANWYGTFFSPDRRSEMGTAFAPGADNWQLWPKLDVTDADLKVDKTRYGAFIQGASDLHAILQQRGIDTVIITGTLTNCCCESTAREAMQLNYKVIFVADGNAALSDAAHNGTLNTMCALYADVMTTDEVTGFLHRATPIAQAAE